MRVLACVAAAVLLFAVPTAAAMPRGLKLLARDGPRLALVYLDRVTPFRQPLTAKPGALGFSGDGRLISVGSTIVGRTTLPGPVFWAPTGERAASVTKKGGVVVWTPAGRRVAAPNGWGAQTVAWSRDGALAIGRTICHPGCYRGTDISIWVWRDGHLEQRLGPYSSGTIPMPFAWTNDGGILWWQWPDSGSIASDGVAVYRDGTRLGTMLMYRDWLAVCGSHIAFAEGHDRESMDGKKIVFDGSVVSGGPKLSWASPACSADGRLVAAASRNVIPPLTYETHRAIWQLLPTRRQLTRPPWGWSDEDPHVFANGDVLFVRTRARLRQLAPGSWIDTQKGRVMLLEHGKLREVAHIGFHQASDVYTYPVQYYGKYDWTQFFAVSAQGG